MGLIKFVESPDLSSRLLGWPAVQIAARGRCEAVGFFFTSSTRAAFVCFFVEQLRFGSRPALFVEPPDEHCPVRVADGQFERVATTQLARRFDGAAVEFDVAGVDGRRG